MRNLLYLRSYRIIKAAHQIIYGLQVNPPIPWPHWNVSFAVYQMKKEIHLERFREIVQMARKKQLRPSNPRPTLTAKSTSISSVASVLRDRDCST